MRRSAARLMFLGISITFAATASASGDPEGPLGGCMDDVPCNINGSCPGLRACIGGHLGPCECIAQGYEQVNCTKCGVATTGVCTETCEINCNGSVAPQSCNPNSCSTGGSKSCQADGGWSECTGCSGTAACTGCDSLQGTKTCTSSCTLTGGCNVGAETCNNCDDDANGAIDNAPGSPNPNTLTQTCNPNSCTSSGSQTCTSGTWGACSGCSGTCGCQTQCTTPGSGTSTGGACSIPVGSCTAPEACPANQCDDDLNGVVDDGISCPPCEL